MQLVLPFGTFERGWNRLAWKAKDDEEFDALREVIEEYWEMRFPGPPRPEGPEGEAF